jgi:hypothetical protein
LHDLMKPVLAHKEIGKKNYRTLEEYLDLLMCTFDIAEEAGMLPIILHTNNLRPMYKKWPHGEQAKWWTHAERFDIMQQPLEFRRYIMDRYKVVGHVGQPHVDLFLGQDQRQPEGGRQEEGRAGQAGGRW